MIDAQKLLDQFLGTGPGASNRHGGASSGYRPTGSSLENQIGGILKGALGGGGARPRGSFGGGGSALPGALAGGLASYLLRGKRGRRVGGSGIKYGGMALIAGLAYKAWQNHQAAARAESMRPDGFASPRAGMPAPAATLDLPSAEGTVFHPSGAAAAEDRARLLLSAMIAAAKADGYIDRDEQEAIFGRVDDLDLDPEEKGLLMDEMRKPLSVDDLVARARDKEVAVEVYTASLLAIDPDHPAERAYLDLLAARLGLPPELVAEIRRTTDDAQE